MKKLVRSIIVTLIIFGLFSYFIARNMSVIRETYQITQSHITFYMLLAFLVSVGSVFFVTRMYLILFEMAKLKRTPREMISLLLQGLAINIIIPTGGISMAVLFADDARSRKESPAQAVNGIFLSLLTDYLAISLLLLLALIFLLTTGSLTSVVLIAAIFFFLLTLGVFLLSYLAFAGSKLVERGFYFIAKYILTPIFKVLKLRSNPVKQVNSFTQELAMAYRSIREEPKDLMNALKYSFGLHFSRIIVLYLIFVSLGIDPLLRQILAAYAIGALFVVVSPTPNGIGFVEGSMGLLLASFGIPASAVATAVILYRAFTFWIPFGIGFFLLQRKRINAIRNETINQLS